jgi:hypothetical protein
MQAKAFQTVEWKRNDLTLECISPQILLQLETLHQNSSRNDDIVAGGEMSGALRLEKAKSGKPHRSSVYLVLRKLAGD